MDKKRFKPLVDRLFLIIFIPTVALVTATAVVTAIFEPSTLWITVPVMLFVLYFLISPLFGYAELGDNSLFIKYGFFLKKEIPYEKIRSAEKLRKFYSESMMSLKCAFEHVKIRYNSFDETCVSVVGNDELIKEILQRSEK